MGVKNRVVALTVGMVVLAGILSGVTSFISTRDTIHDYNDAMIVELERKGRAYAQTGAALLPPDSAEALIVIDTLIDDALAQSLPLTREQPTTSPEEFENPLLGFTAYLADPSAPSGYRAVSSATLDGYEAVVADSEPILLEVVAAAAEQDSAAAKVDSERQTIHGGIPISVDGDTALVAAFTLAADDEFAFFAQQRSAAIRESIFASLGIVLFVAAVGLGLSLYVARDLTSRRRVEDALREQTRRDPLTGVLNHAAIIDELYALLARGNDARAVVIVADVDGMKATNDTFGHQVGDEALRTVAAALGRDGSLIGRYGGDEFIVILYDHDRAAGERFLRETADKLATVSLADPESGIAIPLSLGMGLATWPDEAATVAELVGIADHAMYASRLQRPLPGAGPSMPRRRDEPALVMIGELVPLLTADVRIEDRLRLVAHRLRTEAGQDSVSLAFIDPTTGEAIATGYAPAAGSATAGSGQDRRLPGGASLRPVLARTRRPVIVNEIAADERMTADDRARAEELGVRSAVVAPMVWHDDLLGTLCVASKKPSAFTARDAQFFTAVAAQVAAVLRREIGGHTPPRERAAA